MGYAPLKYNHNEFIRCSRCGVLKKRSYRLPLTNSQKELIVALREQGRGSRAISTITDIPRPTIRRLLKKYPNAK